MSEYPVNQRDPEGKFLPRAYVCYRASAPITIDGNLDKKAWRDASWTECFEDHLAPNAPPPDRTTRAAMLWDDEAIPAECLERLPAPPEPTNPVQRGGGWTVQPANAVSARRDADSLETWNFALGFRCVKEENPCCEIRSK